MQCVCAHGARWGVPRGAHCSTMAVSLEGAAVLLTEVASQVALLLAVAGSMQRCPVHTVVKCCSMLCFFAHNEGIEGVNEVQTGVDRQQSVADAMNDVLTGEAECCVCLCVQCCILLVTARHDAPALQLLGVSAHSVTVQIVLKAGKPYVYTLHVLHQASQGQQ